MADRAGDAVTEYVLTATRFDQVLERYGNGAPKRMIKHRRGDTVTGLPEAEVERLLSAGAIRPAAVADGPATPVEPEPSGQHDPAAEDTDPGKVPGAEDEPGTGNPAVIEQPKKTASTEDWRAYAEYRGMPREEAATKSRAELIEQFGQD